MDSGHGEGFCIGNILKYSQRYGKKDGKNRNDLLKVIHYGIMRFLHNHDTTEKKLMKLSNDTREVLKNFSTINQNLLVKNGTAIGTMSAMKNIVAKATMPDTFNNEFAIYDLNEFLSAMSLFKDPTLTFDDKSVQFNEEGGGSKLTYMFNGDPLSSLHQRQKSLYSVDVEFTFTQDTFNQILKASIVLGVPDVVLTGTIGGDIKLTVTDRKNDTSNDFSITVGENAPTNFTYYFKVENLKLLSGDYKVEVSEKGISHFTNVSKPIEYFIISPEAIKPEGLYYE